MNIVDADRAVMLAVRFMALSLFVAACGDDTSASGGSSDSGSSSADDGASADSTDAGSVDVSTDESVGDTDATTTGTDPDTTGDTGEPAGDLRIYYELDADPEAPVLAFADLLDGILTEPVEIDTFAEDQAFTIFGDRWLAARSMASAGLTAYDLQSAPPFAAWPFELPAEATNVQLVASTNAGSTWLVGSFSPTGSDILVFELADDGPSAPWSVDGDLAADLTASFGDADFVLDGQRIAFRASDEGAGTASLWLGPANEAAPPSTMIAETPDDALFGPYTDQSGTAIVYQAGGIAIAPESAYYIDLASEPIGMPVLLGMLPGMQSVRFARFAPDGSGVAFTQASDVASDIAWIAIADGSPAPPVQVSTGASSGLALFDSDWSPDARWLTFTAGDPYEQFVARFDGGVPDVATSVVEPGEEPDANPIFSPDSQFLYFGTYIRSGEGRVRRIALDGDAPGAPETISGPTLGVFQIVLAEDGRSLYYSGWDPVDQLIHAWWVDLSGDAPARPIRVDSGLAVDEEVFAGFLTPNGSHAMYSVRYDEPPGERHVVVDLSTGVEFSLADGAYIGFAAMQPLR